MCEERRYSDAVTARSCAPANRGRALELGGPTKRSRRLRPALRTTGTRRGVRLSVLSTRQVPGGSGERGQSLRGTQRPTAHAPAVWIQPTSRTLSCWETSRIGFAVRLQDAATAVAIVVAITRLIAYAINDDKRWRRFLFLVFLALIVVTGWWLFADSGMRSLLHDFNLAPSATTTRWTDLIWYQTGISPGEGRRRTAG